MATARQKDPTRTAGIRRMYSREIRRRLRDLDEALRKSVVEEDALGLTNSVLMNAIPPVSRRGWVGVDAATTLRNFGEWLTQAISTGVLGESLDVVPSWIKTYVRAAYAKGVTAALRYLPKGLLGVFGVDEVLQNQFHRDRIEGLFQRNFTELKGLTAEMSTKLQRVMADGLAAGKGPKEIARELRKVMNITRRRAEMIVRTETIRTNAEAQLNTFQKFGITDVTVEAEWLTAGDGRVCPDCAEKSGRIYPIDQARGMIPMHPNCRCNWIPYTKKKETAA